METKMFWSYLFALWRFHDPIRHFVSRWHFVRPLDEQETATSKRSPRELASNIGRRMGRALSKL